MNEQKKVMDAHESPFKSKGPSAYTTGDLRVPNHVSHITNVRTENIVPQRDLFYDYLNTERADERELEYRASKASESVKDYVNNRFIHPANETIAANQGELIYMVSRGFDNSIFDSTGKSVSFVEIEKTHIGVIGPNTRIPEDGVYASCRLLDGLKSTFTIDADEETNDELLIKGLEGDFSMLLRDNRMDTSVFYALADLPAFHPERNHQSLRSSKPRLEYQIGQRAFASLQDRLKAHQYISLHREIGDNSTIPEAVVKRDLQEKADYILSIREAARSGSVEKVRKQVKVGMRRRYDLHRGTMTIPGTGSAGIQDEIRVDLGQYLETLATSYDVK